MPAAVYILRVVDGPGRGRQVVIDPSVEVGRGALDLDLDDPYASRQHIRVEARGREVALEDLGSKRGTFVDGVRVVRQVALVPGSSVVVGGSTLELLVLDPAAGQQYPEPGAGAELRFATSKGRDLLLPVTGLVELGRDAAAVDVVVDHPTVSRRRHCVLRCGGGQVAIEQVGPTAVLSVNGVRVAGTRVLAPGDELRLGSAPEVLVLTDDLAGRRGPEQVAPLPLLVRTEGDDQGVGVLVEAPASAPAGAVFDALAGYLGVGDPAGGRPAPWYGYREDGRVFLDRATPWWAVSVRRADSIVIARLDQASTPPTAGRHAATGWSGPVERTTAHNQRPRTSRPPAPHRPALPNVPEGTSLKGRGVGWQLGAGAASVVVGGIIGAISRNPWIGIGFAAVGLLAVLSSVLADQSRRRHRVAVFRERLAALEVELTRAVTDQRSALWEAAPDVHTLVGWAEGRSPRMWERRPPDEDFSSVRLGLASLPSLIEADESWRSSDSPLAPELGVVLTRHRTLPDVPITTPSVGASVLGLAGGGDLTESMARSLLVQACTLHSPHDLSVAVISARRGWQWTRWIPHLDGGDGARVSWDAASASALATALLADLADRPPVRGPATAATGHLFIVIDGSAAGLAEVAALFPMVHQQAVRIVVVGDDQHRLPPEVDVEVVCGEGAATITGRAVPGGKIPFVPEYLSATDAERVEVALARASDQRGTTQRKQATRDALDLWGVAGLDDFDADLQWSEFPDDVLAAPIGTQDDGQPMVVAFRRNGPHALLAGMTGSGKSVLLQTLLAGLAVSHSPEILNFFLVDYKGGSAFTGLGALPHTVGLVTDLESDHALTSRALTALDAELRRRKEIFAAVGVEKLAEYEHLARAGAEPPLPNLLLVIDEYAALASDEENRDAVEQLNQVAIQGRSLGVHMLLAMQSPQGVVSNAIQKNTNVWLCLRVVDASESTTVVGRPDAALISDTEPGRGYIRLGGGDQIVGFQTAAIADRSDVASAVAIVPFGDLVPPAAPLLRSRAPGTGARPLETLCAHLTAEAARLGLAAQRQLWLAPLPTLLDARDVPEDSSAPTDRLVVTLGLADHPESQRQEPFRVDLSKAGSMLAIGEFGSGKTTTLLQVGVDLALRHPPDACHLYGIDDGGGALSALAALPHAAAVVAADDRERLGRLFGRLSTMVEGRRTQMAVDGQGSWLAWRATTSTPQPWVVLLLDDYPVFQEAVEDHQYGLLLNQLTNLLQAGPQVGIHVVLGATQRTNLRMATFNLFGARVVLRQSDASDYNLGGLRTASATRSYEPTAGRALVDAKSRLEVQIAFPSSERFAEAQVRWPAAVGHQLPRPIEPFPKEIGLPEVLSRGPRPSAAQAVMGLGGAEMEPVLFDHARLGPHLLVVGEDLSGRTNALRAYIASRLVADPAARFAVLLGRSSPLLDLVGAPHVAHVGRADERGAEILAAVLDDPTIDHLIVDDVELLPAALARPFEDLLRQARDRSLHTASAARASDLTRVYEGWVRYLLSFKTGILLMPTADMGAVFDVRLPRGPAAMTPGRGYLAHRGELTALQVALVSP